MLYVFHGTDIVRAGAKARALVESLRAKRPDAAYERMDADSWNSSILEGHLGGQGLFSSRYIVFVDRVTENKEAKEVLPGLIPAMQESPNVFIVLEGKLLTDLKKAVDKNAEKAVAADKAEKKDGPFAGEGFNIFALADAVAKRDSVRAWSLYRKAVEAGSEPEQIIGMLFWKAKATRDKPLAKELVTLYHDGHRGLVDLELGIERLVLGRGK